MLMFDSPSIRSISRPLRRGNEWQPQSDEFDGKYFEIAAHGDFSRLTHDFFLHISPYSNDVVQ
jgi:hypothetical protein